MLAFQKKFGLKAWGNSPFSYVLTRAGIVFGFVTNSVSSWASKFFLTSWFLFFQINLLLARGHVDSELSSYFLTLLVVAGAVIHTVLYNLPSTTLSWVYSWLANRAKFLVVYLGILASFGYLSGASFLSFLVQLRTFFGEAAKNLVETGGLSGIFPYGDLELGFIDVAGAYTLFQGFFISSSGLSLLLQNSMFVSLAFILVFPFCLGTGVFLEGVILSVGFPLFHVPSPLKIPLVLSAVGDLDKKLVKEFPDITYIASQQVKGFSLPKWDGNPKSVIALPYPTLDKRGTFFPNNLGIELANRYAISLVRQWLEDQGSINVSKFLGNLRYSIRTGTLTSSEALLIANFNYIIAVHGEIQNTSGKLVEFPSGWSQRFFFEDPALRGSSHGPFSNLVPSQNSSFETIAAKHFYTETQELWERPKGGSLLDAENIVTGETADVKESARELTTPAGLSAFLSTSTNSVEPDLTVVFSTNSAGLPSFSSKKVMLFPLCHRELYFPAGKIPSASVLNKEIQSGIFKLKKLDDLD